MMPFGGVDVDTAAAGYYTLSFEQAEEKKMKDFSLAQNPGNGTEGDAPPDKIRQWVDMWINEIQKILQFYSNRGGGSRIGEVYLHGGSSNLTGLPEHMSSILNIPVEKIKSISSVQLTDKAPASGLEYFLGAMGAVIIK